MCDTVVPCSTKDSFTLVAVKCQTFDLHLLYGLLLCLQIINKMEKAAKRTLFQELYQLDEDDELQEEDSSNADQFLRRSRPKTLKTNIRAASHQVNAGLKQPRQRIDPAPSSKSKTTPLRQISPLTSTSTPSVSSLSTTDRPKSSTKSEANKGPATTSIAATMTKSDKKRKKEQPLQMKPLSRQLFRGLSFCVFLRSRIDTLL